MKFRKDINGLRAFAVIAVVLFHFNASWMPGGFAGVDVFFVISGFLMTGIIFKGLENNNFSVLNFYVARANRIIPALAALCLALLVFGWFYLTPLEYRALGKHAASSVGFLSNVIYFTEAGYFDAASHEKWLLHTWSLSVEWQFYIIYPLVLLALKRIFSLKALKSLIIVATVIGFIFSVYATYKWPSASYYLFPMRAWEMMLGGVAFLYPIKLQQNNKRLVEILGLILIVGSYIFITGDDPWPGYLALFPVLGTFLVIQAQRNESIITGNIIFQKLGAWSYSIYLWHWPFVVAIYTFSLPDQYIYIGMTLSVLLGYLSYKYIERIKFPRSFPNLLGYLKCKPIYIAGIIGISSSMVFFKSGIPERFQVNAEKQQIMNELIIANRANGYCFYDAHKLSDFEVDAIKGVDCYLGDTTQPVKTLLFGDSYAGHNEPFFDELFKANNSSFQSVVTNWCTPSLSDDFAGPKTQKAYKQCLLNRNYLVHNLTNYKNIIFSVQWQNIKTNKQFNNFEVIVARASSQGVNVIIMAAPKQYKKNQLEEFKKSIYFNKNFHIDYDASFDKSMQKANLRMKRLADKYKNVYFIDRSYLYESNDTFHIDEMDIPYTYDGGHISMLGSKQSAKYFMSHPDYEKIISYFDF